MTKISQVYDALLARLAAIMPSADGWTRLPNPYEIEENPSLFLKQGYGLAIGPGENRNDSVCPNVGIRRIVTVVVSRKVDATEINVTAKDSPHKQLLEDMFQVLREFEMNVSLLDSLGNAIFVADTGVNFVNGEDENYIYSSMQFTVDYFENLN